MIQLKAFSCPLRLGQDRTAPKALGDTRTFAEKTDRERLRGANQSYEQKNHFAHPTTEAWHPHTFKPIACREVGYPKAAPVGAASPERTTCAQER